LPILIQPYRKEHESGVEEFNRRLQTATGEPDLVFYDYSQPRWLPSDEGSELFNEFFVALDGQTVRGGYALKHQNFLFPDGAVRSVGYYHHPLSEGIVDKRYAIVGSLLLRDALQRTPLLYCLGMGGYDRPLPKMLIGLGWTHCLVPFFFRVVRPARFLRQMQALRDSSWRSLAMDIAAFTGLGWAAVKAHQTLAGIRAPRSQPYEVVETAEFAEWVDPLWQHSSSAYAMTAVRDGATLRRLYPAAQTHFTRLRLQRHGSDFGWAVVGERRRDPKYGSMRVGSIVDCWASPGDAFALVQAATSALESRGVDLIVSNQSHVAWRLAFKAAGFAQAQSNFIFAASKKLAELLQPFEQIRDRIHFTRADGDGLPRNF
jgi:hypothetical protein